MGDSATNTRTYDPVYTRLDLLRKIELAQHQFDISVIQHDRAFARKDFPNAIFYAQNALEAGKNIDHYNEQLR